MQDHRNGRVHGQVYLREGARGDVWYARIFTPTKPNGQRKALGAAWHGEGEQPYGTLTRRQAEDKLDEIIVGLRRITAPRELVGVTMRHAIDHWLWWIKNEHPSGLKHSTLKDYESTSKVWVQWFGDRLLTSVDEDVLDEFMVYLKAERGVAKRTRIKHLVTLRQVFARARRKWGLPSNPVELVTRPRVNDEDYFNVLFDWSEVERLADQATTLQDRVIIVVAAGLGVRMGELRALRWSHLFIDRMVGGNFQACIHENYVEGVLGTPKSHARRDIPMMQPVRAALVSLRQQQQADGRWSPDGTVFVEPDGGEFLNDDRLRRRYAKMVAAANLPHMRFHDLRHTFGTMAVRGGLSTETLQQYMGHHSIAVTQRYVHFVMPSGAADALGAALTGNAQRPPHLRAA